MEKGKLIGQGRTAEIYALENNKVLKLFRADMGHKSVEKEYTLGKLISGTGVPSPEVYEMVTLGDRQGIVYQMVTGKTMLEHISRRPHSVSTPARSLACLHHKIHQHTASGLPQQKQILAETIDKTRVLSAPDKQTILDHLNALPPGDRLCHGDFHPDNVMITPDDAVVLDWINASIGNPAADVARTILLLRDAAPPPGISGWKAKLLDILRKKFFGIYFQEYLKISGVSARNVEAWILPVAAARLTENLPQGEKLVLQTIIRQHIIKLLRF